MNLIFQFLHCLFSYKRVNRLSSIFSSLRSRVYSLDFYSFGKGSKFGKIGALVGQQFISIGSNTFFGQQIYLTAWSIGGNKVLIKIGNSCDFGAFNHITASNMIVIGNNVLTGKFVTITDNSHGNITYEDMLIPPIKRPIVSKGAVIIEDNVWIGEKSTILPGVTIGKGCVIAANSVVTHSFPPYSVIAGCPAKIIKTIQHEDIICKSFKY